MFKFFLRFFLIFLIAIILGIFFLSYFGLETNKFNNLIKNKANEVNKYAKVEFNNTKIHLNIKELDLLVKLQNPKILIKNKEIDLSKFDLYLSLKSFYSSDFLLKKSKIGFEKNDIKDITKITSIFLPKIINKRLNKIFLKGTIEGEFVIPFETDGSVAKDYGFSGQVIDASINLTKGLSIINLTTEIIYGGDIKNSDFVAIIKNGSIFEIDIKDSVINLKRDKQTTKVKSSIKTSGNFDFSKIKKVATIFNINVSNFKNIQGEANLKTNIDFDLRKNFNVKNLIYSTEGKFLNAEISINKKNKIKNYLPDYNSKVFFKDTNIRFNKSKSTHKTELNGFIKIGNEFDSFNIIEEYSYNNRNYNIKGNIGLANSKVKISQVNFTKMSGKKSSLDFNLSFITNKNYNVNNLLFIEGKNKILLSNVKLNKKFETDDFKKIEVKTYLNNIKNNDFIANKSNGITILGEVFDAQPLLKSLYKKSNRKNFSKKFSAPVKVNFKKTLTGTNDNVNEFAMVGAIDKGNFNKLSLKGNFSSSELIEMSIYQVDKDRKTLHLISDRARPFIKNFNFIKGFEDGKLEYESNIEKGKAKSNLSITDFKVSEVPALAKLLTLASLQGIADTLSGEGIRFDSFEMKSNSENNILQIEEALAIGPAVSILLDGYVDKGKIVSLRGTLVPATKLNSIIASIPLVGDILVGKKTGEGVIGISFKMKGPPKEIKTTVNPIKTLTPRFIVRAVEKMKKKKKEDKTK